MKLKKLNVKIVNMSNNLKKTVKNVKFNSQGISVKSASCLTTSTKKSKYIIVINAEYAELVEKKIHFTARYANAATPLIKKTITRVFLKN